MAGLRRSAIFSISGLLVAGAIVSQPFAGAAPVRVLASSHPLKSGSLAKVRAIKRGLLVAPPSRQYAKGKVKESLASEYALRTGKKQLASLAFFDGSILHLNQQTDAVLRSASVTTVKKGEVDQITQPGTDHKISTAVAVASAIGTEWDTRCTKKLCVFTDVEGAVLVKGKVGAPVTITTGQQTTVRKGKPPSRPISVDTGAVTSWVHVLPPAPSSLGINLGLSANGGAVDGSSTRPASAGKSWDVSHVDDGDTSTGWQTAQGHVTNEALTFSFGSGNIYEITGIVIDPAATGGEDPSNDLKDFAVKTSRDGIDYATVFTGTTQQKDALQPFPFPSPVDADHVQVQLIDNWGGKDGIAASEVEIVGHKVAVATPKLTATHAATFSVTVRADIGLAPPRISSANTDPWSKAAGIFACDIQAGPSTQPPTAATFCGGLIQSQIDIGGNKHSTPPQVVVSSGARMIHVAVDEFDGSPYGTTPLQSGFADFRLTGPATIPAAEGNYGPLVLNQTTGGPFILDHLGAVEFPFGGRTGDYTLEWNSPTGTGWVTVAILSVSSP